MGNSKQNKTIMSSKVFPKTIIYAFKVPELVNFRQLYKNGHKATKIYMYKTDFVLKHLFKA